jgi:hypothetical protein
MKIIISTKMSPKMYYLNHMTIYSLLEAILFDTLFIEIGQ